MKKYRPYFTYPELEHLSKLLAADISPASLRLSRYLIRYMRDIRDAHIQPATKTEPSLAQRLGMAQELGEFQEDPVDAKNEADMLRYEADQMTPQEEYEFEIRMGLRKG